MLQFMFFKKLSCEMSFSRYQKPGNHHYCRCKANPLKKQYNINLTFASNFDELKFCTNESDKCKLILFLSLSKSLRTPQLLGQQEISMCH
mmetsp:Transcript_45700/g.73490  ORF Transcript_45700/g.73490 Transcript_45700/m.73490 type:complete len:90 (-) Transcript_45700:108-377(-)